MQKTEDSTVACQSLSWDSFPLRNLSNPTSDSVTFTEIDKFLQSEDVSSDGLQRWPEEDRHLSSRSTNVNEISKILIDKSDLVHIDSLLSALQDFGLSPTEAQLTMLKDMIPVQQSFYTKFGDFVDCVKEVCLSDLKVHPEKLNSSVSSGQSCQDCAILRCNILKLKVHVEQLKNRLSRVERVCLEAERRLLLSGKQLNDQTDRTRKLSELLDSEVLHKMTALRRAKDYELRLKASEDKFNSEMDRHFQDHDNFEKTALRRNSELQNEIGGLESINETYKEAIAKVLTFLSNLCDTLKHTPQTPSTKVGRSFSLYRNATVTGAGQCAVPRGAVLRAASVCTSVRPHNPGSDTATAGAKLPISDVANNVSRNRFAHVIKQSEDLIASVRAVLGADHSGNRLPDDTSDRSIKRSSSANKPLQNLPESTVVTVMSMV